MDEVQSLEGEQGQRAEPVDGGLGEVGFYEEVKAYEIFLIRRALLKAGGNQALAARLLGLKATTLFYKLKAYDIKAGPDATARANGSAAGSCADPCTRPTGAS